MTGVEHRFVGRWPVAVLAAAVLAAASLGDLFAGWHSFAERGYSMPGEYPVRIVLPHAPPVGGESSAVILADSGAEVEGADKEAGGTAATLGDAVPDNARIVEENGSALRPGMTGLLAVEFDLADPGAFRDDGASAIEIRKAVRLNGADAGDARIRVAASSTLSMAREELGRLLARAG